MEYLKPSDVLTQSIAITAPRLPPGVRPTPGIPSTDRMLLWGLGVGAAMYAIAPELAGLGRAGARDEVVALMAATGAAAFSTLQKVHTLCESDHVRGRAARTNVAAATAGGTATGATIATLFQGPIAAIVQGAGYAALIDGGIVLIGTLVGAAVARRLNGKPATKECPHRCGYTGLCTQRICRRCLRLYYPSEKPIDCSSSLVLDWYQAASYLQEQKLSYADAEKLAGRFGHSWGLRYRSGRVTVRCAKLVSWVADNLDEIEDARGDGDKDLRNQLSDGPFLEPFKDVQTGSLPSRLEAKIDEFLLLHGC